MHSKIWQLNLFNSLAGFCAKQNAKYVQICILRSLLLKWICFIDWTKNWTLDQRFDTINTFIWLPFVQNRHVTCSNWHLLNIILKRICIFMYTLMPKIGMHCNKRFYFSLMRTLILRIAIRILFYALSWVLRILIGEFDLATHGI